MLMSMVTVIAKNKSNASKGDRSNDKQMNPSKEYKVTQFVQSSDI